MAFSEDWYSDEQLELLIQTYGLAREVPGAVLEIGCWEGKSTVALANACFPRELVAIDTWQGNLDESPDHVTVAIARARDVYRTFRDNMQSLTAGNVLPHRCDWRSYFEQERAERVAFCHIDASHDYRSVRDTILTLLPRMSPGGVLCGDDFSAAHAGRADLQGGVERAVRECLPAFSSRGQFWWARLERA